MSKYPGLVAVCGVLLVIGWLIVGGGIVVGFAVVAILGSRAALIGIGVASSSIVLGISWIAAGETIKVLMDIEKNTRTAASQTVSANTNSVPASTSPQLGTPAPAFTMEPLSTQKRIVIILVVAALLAVYAIFLL
jgi:hypothetical protein